MLDMKVGNLFRLKIGNLFCPKKTTLPPQPLSDGKNYWESLKERKKLCVVIDLDNVLIDSLDWCDRTRYDRNYFSNADVYNSTKEGLMHTLFSPLEITIKLRPYIRSFLRNLCINYDVVLYSKRCPLYVDAVYKTLYPKGVSNITMISLHSPSHQLQTFLANQELLVILDNTKKGWKNKYSRNIIEVDPYVYFCRAKRNKLAPKSWTELKGDELEKAGELFRISRYLGSIGNIFFDPRYGDFQDIRQVIQKLKCKRCRNLYGVCHEILS